MINNEWDLSEYPLVPRHEVTNKIDALRETFANWTSRRAKFMQLWITYEQEKRDTASCLIENSCTVVPTVYVQDSVETTEQLYHRATLMASRIPKTNIHPRAHSLWWDSHECNSANKQTAFHSAPHDRMARPATNRLNVRLVC